MKSVSYTHLDVYKRQVWGNGTLMHTFTLQSSMDGNRWTDVANYSGPDKMASLQVDTQARYLRVYNLYAGDGTKDWTEIAEFYAYGAEAAEETRLDYGVPSYASSSAEGSDPAYGNDGDPAKYWIPSPDDESPWWYFDAGGLYNMSNVQLSWTSEQSHRYTCLLSTSARVMAGILLGQSQLIPKERKQQEIIGVKLVGKARTFRREGCSTVVFLFDQSIFCQGIEHFRNTGLFDGKRRGDVL